MVLAVIIFFFYQRNAKIPPEVGQNRTENEGINAYSCCRVNERLHAMESSVLPMRRVATEATFDEEVVGTVVPLRLRICSQNPV